MHYQTHSPNDALADFVDCYWTLESSEEPGEDELTRQTIVPDGCMEMIFHFGDLYRQYIKGDQSIIQPRCFVFGQLTKPLVIEPTGRTGIFSVRFHPGGFVPFTEYPIKEMENRAVPLEEVFTSEDVNKLIDDILNAKSQENRIEVVEQFLKSLLQDSKTIDRIVKSTVETITTANGQLKVSEVSDQLNTNVRQLERKFANAVGLSPKQLSKTIRLQAALKLLLNKKHEKLTSLAYEGEFYDQAHFIRDFKSFTGLTPKEFYGDHLKMSSLFFKE